MKTDKCPVCSGKKVLSTVTFTIGEIKQPVPFPGYYSVCGNESFLFLSNA